jgi:hypothetical protein
MANYTLTAPIVGLPSPTSWGSRVAIEGQLRMIWNKYWRAIKFASEQSGIPAKVLTSFIAVESGGNYKAGSGATVGLFQYNANYVNSQLKNEFLAGRLSDAEKAKLAEYGFKFDANGNTRLYTIADNLKPELNVLIGSIILAQLIDQPWATTNGEIRLDKVVVIYNSGMYSKWSKIAMASKSANAKQLYDELAGNAVTRAYIAKIMAVNGSVDILTNELKTIVV